MSDQDKAAIRQLDDNFIKATTSEKPDWDAALAAYYAEDATSMMPNMPAAKGRAAIKAAFSQMPPIKDFKLTEVGLDGAGDFAYRHYAYVMALAVPGAPGGAAKDKGKGREVFKRQVDGTWRVIRDVGNSDLPSPGLTIPTAAMAADASPEVKKLGGIVGRWQIGGMAAMEPKAPPQPVTLSLDCQWFAGGREVVCAYTGVNAGQPYQESDIYSYDSRAKIYSVYSAMNPGGVMPGKMTIEPGTWSHVWDFQVGGKPARLRLVILNMTPEGGAWRNDISIAGGPWIPLGEGKYAKAK